MKSSPFWPMLCLLATPSALFPLHPTNKPQETLKNLTLDEKIGQLFMITALAGSPEENKVFIAKKPYRMDKAYIEHAIATYHVGGIIYLGKNDPETLVNDTTQYQKLSSIPLLIGMDFEWGLAMRLNNTIAFPRAMTLGALTDNTLIEDVAFEIGTQARSLGVHLIFAPVVDVNTNPRNPIIGTRSFGDCPTTVAQKGIAFMQGLEKAGIISCAKHFPGHGDTATDSHLALPRILHTKERIYATELVPFKAVIHAGVPAIMVAHIALPAFNTDPDLPATLSPKIITTLLKHELGFSGLIITDGLDMQGITTGYDAGESALLALRAGCDMLLCPADLAAAHASIKQAIINGTFDEAELNAHVLKILQAKEWAHQQGEIKKSFSLQDLHQPRAYELKQKIFDNAITIIGDEISVTRKDDPEIPIIIITPCPNKTESTSPEKILEQIRTAHEQGKKVIIVIYDSPYKALPYVQLADTIIIAYEDMPEAHKAVEAIMAGTIQARGKAPIKFF